MAFGVLIHRSDSLYDDVPAERYQFPKQYLSRMIQFKGDWVVYLEPSKVRETRGYFAVAKVEDVIPDPRSGAMHLAIVEPGTYLDFGDPVPFRDDTGLTERGLLNESGKISGRAQAAVRELSPEDFARIVSRGLADDSQVLPRVGKDSFRSEFDDMPAVYDHLTARDRVTQLLRRPVRDRNFRKTILRAYGARCAITGLRLINGGGRAEVEAAHIQPVEHNGPDIVSNGIALCGTAHWMFDRGMVGLGEDLRILVSRQSNDPEAVRAMINRTGKLLAPDRLAHRPRAEFVDWHRTHCFKQ